MGQVEGTHATPHVGSGARVLPTSLPAPSEDASRLLLDARRSEWANVLDVLGSGSAAAPSTLLNARDRDGTCLLHLAVMQGKDTHVAILLRMGAEPSTPDTLGRTPMWYAAERGTLSSMRTLASVVPADAGKPDREGQFPIHAMVHHRAPDLLRRLQYLLSIPSVDASVKFLGKTAKSMATTTLGPTSECVVLLGKAEDEHGRRRRGRILVANPRGVRAGEGAPAAATLAPGPAAAASPAARTTGPPAPVLDADEAHAVGEGTRDSDGVPAALHHILDRLVDAGGEDVLLAMATLCAWLQANSTRVSADARSVARALVASTCMRVRERDAGLWTPGCAELLRACMRLIQPA